MVRRAKRGGTKSGQKPMTVIVAPDGDKEGARVDMQIAQLRRSESTLRFLSKSFLNLSSPTTSGGGIVTFSTIVANEDFASLAGQFKEFRISAIRYELFHTGTPAGPSSFSTFHADGGSVTTDEESVVDGEDAKYFEPGAGKQVWYWQPSGSLETQYQGVNSYTDYGGLRYYQNSGTGTPAYGKLVISAIVLFRART